MTADGHDARLARRATGLLRACNEVGVLTAADVHVAQRLGALGGEDDERVLLAVALAVRGTRRGSVALRLADVPGTVTADDADEDGSITAVRDAFGAGIGPAEPVTLRWPEPAAWLAAVQRSPLVTTSEAHARRPLHLWDGGLWLDRYWRQEVAVADDLLRRAASPPAVDAARLRAALERLWPGSAPDDQRLAAAVCVLSGVAVLGGGPGTGKTTTVARLLAALRQVASPAAPPRIALAAPTGKAAARLQEAVQRAAASATDAGAKVLVDADRDLLSGMTASTLHRLLGIRRGSARPWHHAGNRLPHDVVVVDEASMVALPLFARLLDALRPSARLVLVGDPDQLASVEAGAVLADLVAPARDGARTPALLRQLRDAVPHDVGADALVAPDTGPARVRDGVALLRTVHRYDRGGAIDELARAMRAGNAEAVLGVLRRGDDAVRFSEVPDGEPLTATVLTAVRSEVVDAARPLVAAAQGGEAAKALAALERHRLLCAHRRGPRGAAHWTAVVQRWLEEELGVVPRRDGRYAGLPLLVTANDHDNRLYNGDTGVVLDRDGDPVAVFGRGDVPYDVPLGRLSDVRPVHAMTVHRSQGSQFDRVTVLLPRPSSPLGTRETLYTAMTRARTHVHVVGSAAAVVAAVHRPVARATGLQQRLA